MGPRFPFATPIRHNALTPFQTLPRTSTVRRTVQRRAVSDREAMKQLVDCVGMSARKKVLESGRKPRVLQALSGSAGRAGTLKELRFDRSVAVVGDAGGVSFRTEQPSHSHSNSQSESILGASMLSASLSQGGAPAAASASVHGSASGLTQEILVEDLSSDLESGSDAPPSPSPTPRPGSAMSILSRRSQTPTGSYMLTSGHSKLRPRDEAFALAAGHSSRRSVSPSPAAPETVKTTGANANASMYTDKSSFRSIGDGDFSYEALDQMERRHRRLLDDIAIAERRLEEAASLMR